MNTRKPQKMMALILSCILLSGLQVENIFANSGIIATSAGENGNDSENKNDSGDYYNQGEEVKAGSCGKSATWTYESGVLTVKGTGEMSSEVLSGSLVPWIDESDSITKLVISDGITKIGGFSNLCALEKVVFGSDVITIAPKAFYGCNALLSCDLNEGVTSVGSEAFSGCESLISVTIPTTLSEIGDKAFLGCGSLYSVVIPKNVTAIGSYAFGFNKASASDKKDGFIITGYNDSIAKQYATSCEITFASLDVTNNPSGTCENGIKWEIKNGTLFITGQGKIPNYASASKTPWSDEIKNAQITKIELASGITGIGNYAFSNIRNVDTIVIPNTLLEIGEYAFSGSSIKVVEIPDSVNTISKGAFMACKGLVEVTLGKGLSMIGESAFEECTSLEQISVPGNIVLIGSRAFKKCTALDTVSMSSGVKEIGSEAFLECSKLRIVLLSNTVKTIGVKSFSNCKSLASIKIPGSVVSIADQAFTDCTALRLVEFEDGIKKIGAYVFSGCSGINKVNIPNSVTEIAEGAFLNCSSIFEAVIGTRLRSISARMFENCSTLKSISLSEGLMTIGERAFVNCKSLSSINIPQSVTSIYPRSVGYTLSAGSDQDRYTPITGFTIFGFHPSFAETYADQNGFKFNSNGSLNEVSGTFGKNGSLKWSLRIESGTFRITGEGVIPDFRINEKTPWSEYKKIIKCIIIDRGITEIGAYSFSGCEELISVSFPTTLVSIGSHAFDGCLSIDTVELPSSLTDIGDYAFSGCMSIETARMPEGLLTIGERAFYDCTRLDSISIGKNVEKIGAYAIGYSGETPTQNYGFVIYGSDNSVAKTYAATNRLSFANSSSLEFTDPETKIVISFSKPETDFELNIKKVRDEDRINYIITSPTDETDIFITSLIKQGEVVDPSGKVVITVPVPEGADPYKCRIYRVCGSGSFELIESEIDGGTLKFEASDMYDFIITEADLSNIYTAKIDYIYENGATVADSVSVFCAAGAEFDLPSPVIENFTASSETLKVTVGNSDIDYTVTYTNASESSGTAETSEQGSDIANQSGYTILLVIELIVLTGALAATATIIIIYMKRRKAAAEESKENTVVINKTDISGDTALSDSISSPEQDFGFEDDLVFDETQFEDTVLISDENDETVFDENILAIIEKEEDEDSDMKIVPDKSSRTYNTNSGQDENSNAKKS